MVVIMAGRSAGGAEPSSKMPPKVVDARLETLPHNQKLHCPIVRQRHAAVHVT